MKTITSFTCCRGFALLIICFLSVQVSFTQTMLSTVNSLADDDNAHPWDDPDTPEDESIDGICEDMAHRCTLRAALEEATIIGAKAYVTFEASLSGNLLIDDSNGILAPPDGSVIQGVDQKVILYGSDPGSSILLGLNNTTAISGLGFANGLIGLVVGGEFNLVGGIGSIHANYFHNFSQNGIVISGDKNTIVGNRIGIAFDNTPVGSQFGILLTGKQNMIGGTEAGDANIISGNDIGIGIYTIEDSNYIYGNLIGSSLDGTFAVPNRVGIDNIGPNIFIGGNLPNQGNLISGNLESGILMGIDADNSFIQGNKIGTDITGSNALPNRDGITLGPGSANLQVDGNNISFNSNNGVLVSGILGGIESDGHRIFNNEISFNGEAGIAFTGAALNTLVGSSLTDTYQPNRIHDNGSNGIVLISGFSGDPQFNTIRKNNFQDNGTKGIFIFNAQNGIQPPEIASYLDPGSGTVSVEGTHPIQGATIDVYAGAVNQSGNYEGFEWMGSGVVDANGHFLALVSGCNCDTIVATATDPMGNTSEFSKGFPTTITSIRDEYFDPKFCVHPNPFQAGVNFEFSLIDQQEVDLMIYDVSGQKIASIIQDKLQAGEYKLSWNPDGLKEGIYYFQLMTELSGVLSGKLVFAGH